MGISSVLAKKNGLTAELYANSAGDLKGLKGGTHEDKDTW
jgi:hypothetical protein